MPTLDLLRGPGPRKRILLVEDDEPQALALKELLQHQGYEVLIAPDGADALKRLTAFAPNTVLLDMQLPVLDGAAFLRAIQDAGIGPGLPVIIVSALPATLPDGAVAYLRKPFEAMRLIELVKNYAL